MKNLLKILILCLTLVSCKKEIESKSELLTSNFNLNTDLINFKERMTDLDTLMVLFDHSVCDQEGYERIEITKSSDSIKVRSEFLENYNEFKWNMIYEKKILATDTIWQFGKFLNHNENLKIKTKNNRKVLVIKNKEDSIAFYVNNLGDLNHFLEDYYLTMRQIYPENKNAIYGYEVE